PRQLCAKGTPAANASPVAAVPPPLVAANPPVAAQPPTVPAPATPATAGLVPPASVPANAASAPAAVAGGSCDIAACSQTYTSFRASDCTFQPYGDGPRQVCTKTSGSGGSNADAVRTQVQASSSGPSSAPSPPAGTREQGQTGQQQPRVQAAHEAAVDLDLVERQRLQVAQAGVAGPEVVERNAHAQPA